MMAARPALQGARIFSPPVALCLSVGLVLVLGAGPSLSLAQGVVLNDVRPWTGSTAWETLSSPWFGYSMAVGLTGPIELDAHR